MIDRISEEARLPPALVAGLGVGYVLTRSFKMQRRALNPDRYLMTLNKAPLGEQADGRILEVCRGLSMPQALVAPFTERLKPANYVHFGFERSGGACLYKVYMEYWTTWQEELEAKRRSEPFVGGYGYKWDPADADRCALTRYVCHPLLGVETMLERVARLCERAQTAKPVEIARVLLEAAARRIAPEKMLYLEADEAGNPRCSFDINLLQAKVLLGDLYGLWDTMCRHYEADVDAFDAMLAPIRDEPFAHIQGGVDRQGRDFITIYYGCESH